MIKIKVIISLLFLFVSSFALAQIVNIPDTNFKNALVNTNCIDLDGDGVIDSDADINDDGEIQVSEANNYSGRLALSNRDINDLTGIEAFINITRLDVNNNNLTTLSLQNNSLITYLSCEDNSLTGIDISNNLSLLTLHCSNNQLTTLDVGDNTALGSLYCDNNLLTSLDIGENVALVSLFCYNNQLSALDVSTNTALQLLICNNNQLTIIDVGNITSLYLLNCQFNQLTSLNLSNNNALEFLECSSNLITDLNVSHNLNLLELSCDSNQITNLNLSQNKNLLNLQCNDNQLVSLNIKNGSLENTFDFSNNLDLEYICADEDQIADIEAQADNTVMVGSYCSFVPGGDYNNITGNVKYDFNNNGCDINDPLFEFIKLNMSDGLETVSFFTTDSGFYNFYTQEGDFTIIPDIENLPFFNITPIDAAINFPDTNNNITIQDFCITANGVHPDIEVAMAPIIDARPGFDTEYLITYNNKGNQTLSGNVDFSFDDSVLDFVTSTETPTTQTTGVLTWDYSDLLPFESRSIYVTLNVNSPMEIPAVNIDDQLDFSVIVNPIVGDDFPADNTFGYKQIVIGSYDPNDITCLQGDMVEPSEIGNYLHYIINFENTGNAAAENVVVKTEIDPTQFNIGTLRLLSSSHNPYVRVKDNTIEFIFENIYLEASGGHGNILLRMQTNPDIEINDTVTKDAEIFFDYNFPIETNDANTTFATLSNPDFEIDKSVSLYPNPVKNTLKVKANNVIISVSIYDVQGRLLQTKINSTSELDVDLSTRSNGIYFVKIITEKGTNVEKIIKQ